MRTKASFAGLLARRFNLVAGRIVSLADRLPDPGLAPRSEGSRRYPPSLMDVDLVRMLIATITDQGLRLADETTAAFSALTSATGHRLDKALLSVLRGETDVSNGGLVIRFDPPSVAMTTAVAVHYFGAPVSADDTSKAVLVSGSALAAVVEELRGHSPAEADVIVGIAARSSTSGHSRRLASTPTSVRRIAMKPSPIAMAASAPSTTASRMSEPYGCGSTVPR